MLREKQQLLNGFFWQCSGYVMEVGIYESRLGSQEKQNMMPQHPNQNLIFQLVKPPQHLCPMLKHPSLKKKKGGGSWWASPACSPRPGQTGMGYNYSLPKKNKLRIGVWQEEPWRRRKDQCHMTLNNPNQHLLIILFFHIFKLNTALVLQVDLCQLPRCSGHH